MTLSEGKPRVKGSKSSAGTGVSAAAGAAGGGERCYDLWWGRGCAWSPREAGPRKGKSKTLTTSDLHPGPPAGSPPLTVPATLTPTSAVTATCVYPPACTSNHSWSLPAPGLKRGREGAEHPLEIARCSSLSAASLPRAQRASCPGPLPVRRSPVFWQRV